jgi:nicotinate-nucleotide adenylyltransferase
MRVAFFGGSFDPPHCGHLAIARAARERLGLDRVLFAPVGWQPLKQKGASASFADRVAMTRLAIAGEAGCELSLIDAPREAQGASAGTPNYTAETLEQLRAEMPGDALYLLMGADSLRTLKRWHRAEEIPFLAQLIVAARPGEQLEDVRTIEECMPAGISVEQDVAHAYLLRNTAGAESTLTLLPELSYEISATKIRAAMRRAGGAERGVIPDAVLAYIREHGLYR